MFTAPNIYKLKVMGVHTIIIVSILPSLNSNVAPTLFVILVCLQD